MSKDVIVKEASVDEAVKVNSTIIEFAEPYDRDYMESRYAGKEKLIIVSYIDNEPTGYIIGYDAFDDGSFYCWMAGVNPKYRKMGSLKALMDYEEKWAKDRGYNKIKIKTWNNKRAMISYLVKYGFNFTEVVEYPNIGENRLLLEKEI